MVATAAATATATATNAGSCSSSRTIASYTNCSIGAGGLWMPFHCDDPRIDRWAMETLDELMAFAQEADCDLAEIVPTISLMKEHGGPAMDDYSTTSKDHDSFSNEGHSALPAWTRDKRIQFQHLTVEMLAWQNLVNRLRIPPEQELKDAGYLYAYHFLPPIINVPKMIQFMLDEILKGDVDINLETNVQYESLDEMKQDATRLGCDAIVNCTGFGARRLCRDEKVIGARGILIEFQRDECIRRPAVTEGAYGNNIHDAVITVSEEPWGSETYPAYIIPRGSTVVVGGSYLEGDYECTIRDDERERLMLNAERLGIDTQKATVIGEWVGFRPFRSPVRCELEANESDDASASKGPLVFHSYGHGGSGWTVNVGAAKECADILLATLQKRSVVGKGV
jgi:D-amino-acid oxidase